MTQGVLDRLHRDEGLAEQRFVSGAVSKIAVDDRSDFILIIDQHPAQPTESVLPLRERGWCVTQKSGALRVEYCFQTQCLLLEQAVVATLYTAHAQHAAPTAAMLCAEIAAGLLRHGSVHGIRFAGGEHMALHGTQRIFAVENALKSEARHIERIHPGDVAMRDEIVMRRTRSIVAAS